MKPWLLLLSAAVLTGCVGGSHFDEEVLKVYQGGRPREEIQKGVGFPPIATAVRPGVGWHPQQGVNHDIDSFAANYEKEKQVTVQQVDVYWIGRGTSVPLVAGGVWWDYLFYDGTGNLLGYRRRFLD